MSYNVGFGFAVYRVKKGINFLKYIPKEWIEDLKNFVFEVFK